ncbi:MAG: SpoIIE family protein phosphatase [Ignavibacteriales bacterium]|nr:hypothetical protein [Ignavibacteriaceae bacterium]MBW7872194.1 SpoIIE family protein phosphatase [Ignavibacteria bacterium]MBZ0197367.1 SpoIIE family protein phosphatase [Ignavibacteriaceae bacterium]MCZ2144007.1 SpoIIE family protein phosphatase [Ignavibacteriales bacterium]WKZ73381.1 MAG: SpoIIE family protein phosphatase [Ignavibacteriaceae bacterium]
MKILFCPLSKGSTELCEILAPGGDVLHSEKNDMLEITAKQQPDSVVLHTGSYNKALLKKIRLASPHSFIVLLARKDESALGLDLLNTGKIDFFLNEDLNEKEVWHLKDIFWAKKNRSSENLTDNTLLKYYLSRIDLLHNISLSILENKPIKNLFDEIMIASREVMNAEKSSFMLFDKNDGMLHFHLLEEKEENKIKDQPLELGSGIAGWVAKHRVSQLVTDCYSDNRFNPDYDKISGFTTKNMVCVPILKNNNLIGVLSVINKKDEGCFVVEDLKLLETLAGQCAVAIENSRLLESKIEAEALKKELARAHEIQQQLLPKTLPVFPTLEPAARLIPAEQVGGDYYTMKALNDHTCLLMVADVSGKGIPAALIVSTVDATLETINRLNPTAYDPAWIISVINDLLCITIPPEKFVTAWIGVIDTKKGELKSVNAGHNNPVLLNEEKDEVFRLKMGGFFLGVMPSDYDVETIPFTKGDVLVFFSDGVVEAMDPNMKLYTDEKLIDTLVSVKKESSSEIVTKVIDSVVKHADGTPQSDDITLCVVKAL